MTTPTTKCPTCGSREDIYYLQHRTDCPDPFHGQIPDPKVEPLDTILDEFGEAMFEWKFTREPTPTPDQLEAKNRLYDRTKDRLLQFFTSPITPDPKATEQDWGEQFAEEWRDPNTPQGSEDIDELEKIRETVLAEISIRLAHAAEIKPEIRHHHAEMIWRHIEDDLVALIRAARIDELERLSLYSVRQNEEIFGRIVRRIKDLTGNLYENPELAVKEEEE